MNSSFFTRVPVPWGYLPALLANASLFAVFCILVQLGMALAMEMVSGQNSTYTWTKGFFMTLLCILTCILCLILYGWVGDKTGWCGIKTQRQQQEQQDYNSDIGMVPSLISKILFAVVVVAVLGTVGAILFIVFVFWMITPFGEMPTSLRSFYSLLAFTTILLGIVRFALQAYSALCLQQAYGTGGTGDQYMMIRVPLESA